MNPPEQAPALKEIYEARMELVRQNEVEIADLKLRLDQATRRNEELVAQMTLAKRNYEEAASKIVDLMNDNDESGEDDGIDRYTERYGNESKHSSPDSIRDRSRRKIKQKATRKPRNDDCAQSDDEDTKPPATQHRVHPSRTPPQLKPTPSNYTRNMMVNEVVDLLDSDEDSGGQNSSGPRSSAKTGHATKRSRASSPSTNTGSNNTGKESSVAQKRSKSSSPRIKEQKSDGSNPDISIPAENLSMKNTDNCGDENKSLANTRIRSSSTSSCGNEKSVTASKKRSSSSTALSRRIKLRPRPCDIPPERWLKSSVGRTRQELNNIDDMVQYMGSCQFGQSVVVSKFGKVHAIVLNDEWNELAQRNDEYQLWYVGLGPGRKRDARLVGASRSTIPIFHAPKVEYTTKELFYVGHYRVRDIEDLKPPIFVMNKERDMRITFAFDKFDEQLDSIIKRGPNRDE